MLQNNDLKQKLEASNSLLKAISEQTKDFYDIKSEIDNLYKENCQFKLNYLYDLFPSIDRYDFDDEDE